MRWGLDKDKKKQKTGQYTNTEWILTQHTCTYKSKDAVLVIAQRDVDHLQKILLLSSIHKRRRDHYTLLPIYNVLDCR